MGQGEGAPCGTPNCHIVAMSRVHSGDVAWHNSGANDVSTDVLTCLLPWSRYTRYILGRVKSASTLTWRAKCTRTDFNHKR